MEKRLAALNTRGRSPPRSYGRTWSFDCRMLMSRLRERGKTHGMVDSCKSGGRLYICTDNTACDRQPVRPGTKPTDKTGRNAQAGPEQHTDDAQHHCDTSRDRGGFHTSPRSDKSCFPGYRRKRSYRAPSRRKAETVRRIYSGTFLSSRDS